MEIQINCLGDFCPIPMIRLIGYEERLKSGDTIKLVCDHSCVVSSLNDYCTKKHLVFDVVEPISGVWEFFIRKA